MTSVLVQKIVKMGDGSTINVDFVDINNDGTQLVALGSTQISDGVAPLTRATVSQSHTGDEQTISTGNSLLTNAVGSIQGPVGKADVQRGVAFDAGGSVGIPSGAQNYGVLNVSTFSGNITASGAAQAATVGSTANMTANTTFALCSPGTANQEVVFVTAVGSPTTFTAIFTKNHTAADAVRWFSFNVARDAGQGDQIANTGLSASMTYLWNATTQLAEFDRSADGERDGASGKGTAVAAEFEWNAGGPLTNTGAASLLQYDRARNVQGKGPALALQSAGGLAGATSITASSAASTNSLQPGQQIRIDRNLPTEESAYVSGSYVSGTAAIVLQSALAFNHTLANIEWDVFSSLGPGLAGFGAAGIGIEEEALFNPVDGKFYIERSATQDAMPGANIVAEAPALFNGGSFDRARTDGGGRILTNDVDHLGPILKKLWIIANILAEGLNVNTEFDGYGDDPSIDQSIAAA